MLSRRDTGGLIGGSEAMRALRAEAERAGPSDAPVLVVGPSGSGKELVARLIHAAGPRAKRELVTVNCAALQENLLESELFGHERGAFTGATEQRPGLLETAHRTSLFLDEVGELPPGLQAKLLRAIQFGEIRRVGGVSNIKVDVRIIAATNRDLAAAVREGTFREDLFYRLNVLAVRVPPLREHPEDIPELAAAIARRLGLGYELDERHLDILRAYPWPGNVRELENLMERLKIRESDGAPSTARLRELLGPVMDAAPAVVRPLAEIERDAIEAALRHFAGDRKAAAEALGISVRTLYYRIASYRGENEPAE
jgi:transcriptional regulator with PAS, ATPase and Fis domain